MSDNNKSNYYELLKHPKWQRKRLEILEAANFECGHCGSKEKTLHVHHKYYKKGLKPWEYPNTSLLCLCEECHTLYKNQKDKLNKLIGFLGFSDIEELSGYAQGIYFKDHLDESPSLGSFEEVMGFSQCWEIKKPQSIIDLITTRQTNGHDLKKLKDSKQ
jgi:hypothetical protein